MSWRTYACHVCLGQKHIEIGRNIDNQQEKIEICPICLGKGYLSIHNHPYLPASDNFLKRMMGDGGLV